jgi:hypothetical protein
MRKRGLVVIPALAFIAVFLSMRKELPYNIEIVPRHDKLLVLNTTSWSTRDLTVSCQGSTGVTQRAVVMSGMRNQCEIPGLDANEKYLVRIRRADLLGRLRYKSSIRECTIPEASPQYVVLVGASVGKEWNLPALPNRLHTNGYVFGYRGKYSYDKTDVLESLVNSPYKPDIVIIKECAAYFPKESESIRVRLPQWVDMLESNDITPVLATCCPVTEENDRQNPGRQAAINEFNQFVRAFAEEKNLGLLDLEKTLRIGDNRHYLKGEYASPDGLHLVSAAYHALDPIVLVSLAER